MQRTDVKVETVLCGVSQQIAKEHVGLAVSSTVRLWLAVRNHTETRF